ncbi:MAG: helix-turn-helix domain-containing protein [Actinomycetota bacterium]|nr:helix-turn-helix domain-containing protein [Actinomycetota bacterium]
MIDQIRHDIQHRLDQLLAEVEKLRKALAALDPRERSTASPVKAAKPRAAARKPSSPKRTSTRTRTTAVSTASNAKAGARTAPGTTKAAVLAALSSNGALTAGEVAKATGLGRATISTTLSKLAKSGEVAKADRGYRLP